MATYRSYLRYKFQREQNDNHLSVTNVDFVFGVYLHTSLLKDVVVMKSKCCSLYINYRLGPH